MSKKVIPFNTMPDGTCRTLKSQYFKNSVANFLSVWKSSQNGAVYDTRGIAPTICVGHHAGVEPKIIVYEDEQENQD